MKIQISITIGMSVALYLTGYCPSRSFAAESDAPPERIGIYDSRTIAYADFCSETQQKKLNELVKSAREAKGAGRKDRFDELSAALKALQDRNHLQVFSTAPVDEILARMPEQVAAIQKEAGVSRLVSKWDEAALQKARRAQRIDVTDRLLREFKLTEKQQQIAADLRNKPPLPLKKAEKLTREGKL